MLIPKYYTGFNSNMQPFFYKKIKNYFTFVLILYKIILNIKEMPMKRKIIFSIILVLTLLLIVVNFKVLAMSNIPIEENNIVEDVQNNEEDSYGILDSKDQILENIQHLSEAKPRDPKGGLVMIIITITVAIIIVLISWWYSTNY